ncbi:MAG TPA: cyclase family protein [Candidatus Binatia bacterium]|nr:cyclase family protein [Candidatus Binatia bacterium]
MLRVLALAAVPALAIALAANASAAERDAGATRGAAPGPALVAAVHAGKVVDLTYAFDESTVYWPTEDGFQLEKEHDGPAEGGWFYAANRFRTAEHGGTHMDAPRHFAEGKDTADRVPLSALVAPVAVVDVSASAERDRDYRVQVSDLEAWEKKHGRVPDGAIVLMRSGWGARWPDKGRYLGTAEHGDTRNLHFPGFSKEAAEWLVRDRSVAAIAVDTASIDHGPSRDFIVHQIVNGANKPGFENVAHAELLPEAGATLVVLPMKIGGGSGGPARIIAILP